MKILVEAKVRLDPARRAAALAEAHPWIAGALAQPGCLAYAWTPDPHEPDLVRVFEEWQNAEALAAHLAGPQYRGMLAHVSAFGITEAASRKFLVAQEGPVYDASGVATAAFEQAL